VVVVVMMEEGEAALAMFNVHKKISRKLLNRYSTHVCSLIGILVSSQQWYLLVKMA